MSGADTDMWTGLNVAIGELPLWIPAAVIFLLPAIYVLVRLVLGCGAWLVRAVARHRGVAAPDWLSQAWAVLSKPSAFLITAAIHGVVGGRLPIPDYHRYFFTRTVKVLVLAGLVWWLWRLQDLLSRRIRAYVETTNAGRAQSVWIIGRRMLKGTTIGLVVLIALAAFGVDLSATLAGLGIGGLALAFAAQKTLENVFGGISVLGDKSIVVGDYCRVGQYTGTVEDVGLRAMRLRTLARTVVHVPNGVLATMELENFSRRDKFLLSPIVALRCETTSEQLIQILETSRRMLAADARIEQDTVRVRFVRFGPYSLDVEIFAYVRAADYVAFLAVQEEILLRLMHLVSEAGTGIALPPPAAAAGRA